MATTARQELTTLHGYHSKAWSNKLHGYHSKARTNPAVWLPQQWSVCGERRRNLQSSKGQATGPRSSTTQALELYQRQILHIYIQSVYDLFWAPRYKSDILARTELRERERERGGGERESSGLDKINCKWCSQEGNWTHKRVPAGCLRFHPWCVLTPFLMISEQRSMCCIRVSFIHAAISSLPFFSPWKSVVIMITSARSWFKTVLNDLRYCIFRDIHMYR